MSTRVAKTILRRAFSAISVILAVVLLISGCGSKESDTKGGLGGDGKVVNLRYAYIGNEPKGQAEVTEALNKAMAEDGVGVSIEFVFIPSDEYVNKLVMIAAAKEDYDICWTMPTNMPDLVSRKGLAPLNESLDKYGQNLKEAISDLQWREVTIDGKIYGVPGLLPAASCDRTLFVRKDFMKKYGIEKIETLEDFEKYIRAYKKDRPEGIAIRGFSGRELFRVYGDIFEPIGKELNSPVCVELDDPNMEVKNFYKTDIFLNIIHKIREWHAEGLYEIEPPKDLEALFAQGLCAAMWSVLNTHERISYFKANCPEPDGMIESILLNPDKPKNLIKFGADNLSVFSMCDNVDAAVKFISWIRGSQEAYDLISYGIEGVHYKLDGEAISYEGIPPEKMYLAKNWMWSDIRYMRFDKALGNEYKQMLLDWDKDAKSYPFTSFTLNRAPINDEINQIAALTAEYVPQLKNSKIDFQSTYETFLKKLDQAGMDKIIAEVTKQMKEYIEKNK